MAAGFFAFVSILLYFHTSTGESPCREDQFTCWADSTCLPLRYRCDADPDCSDGADEAGCGDILRVCHCKVPWECRLSASCEKYGCEDGWQGYKCAFEIKPKIHSTFHPTTSTQSNLDTSCHCADQSVCADRIYSKTCYCQQGWKGDRCSERMTYITDESLGLIGGVIIVLLVTSVVGLVAFCLSRMRRRRGIWRDDWPYRGMSNSRDSEEGSSGPAIPPHLFAAPPSYEDVVTQGTGRNASHHLNDISDRNQTESLSNTEIDIAPPSYESIIKNQQEQSNHQDTEPVHENVTREANETEAQGAQTQNDTTSETDTIDNTVDISDRTLILA